LNVADRPLPESDPIARVQLGEGFRLRRIERQVVLARYSFGYTIAHDCTWGGRDSSGVGHLLFRGRCSACGKEVVPMILARAPARAVELGLTYLAPSDEHATPEVGEA
jgi:hypothetical protein